ncbi:MAG TPA: helix-turn-helix transcriptional regulator [Bacillota bacterium]|nr:helix-turn-helix transcriptional regulator [Bacillota bacterium]HPJ85462.1 helix-turn-helix transcriptional regulator [Bacillota bacterium]HPQ61916.1 helix-turn-helix transcriptional regulator [Bacillota bacterium]
MINENTLRETIAKNLTRYRKANNLTQLQLAEKLNYSDKSISKWERGEGIPDLLVLASIADLYDITINDIVTDRKKLAHQIHAFNKIMISLISFTGVWFLATIIFVTLRLFVPELTDRAWMSFIYSIPISLIVLLVFASIWGKRIHLFFCVSLLSWSVPLALFLSFDYLNLDLWLLFIAIIPLQVITIMAFILKSKKTKS